MTNNENDQKLLSEISNKRTELENQLRRLEKSIYDIEGKYLENTQSCGNIVTGWEQQLTAKTKISGVSFIKKSKFSLNERIFSQSSYSNKYTGISDENCNASHIMNSAGSSNPHKHRKMYSSLSLKKRKLTNWEIVNGRALMNSHINRLEYPDPVSKNF